MNRDCSEQHESGYVCTLPVGHEGQHEARGRTFSKPYRVWPNLASQSSLLEEARVREHKYLMEIGEWQRECPCGCEACDALRAMYKKWREDFLKRSKPGERK